MTSSCSRSTPARGKLWQLRIPAAAGAGKRQALAADMMVPSSAEDAGAAAAQLNATACWGAQLNGGAGCTDYFVPGKLHFKNNFCDNCRDSIIVPLAYVCALSPEQAECFVNKLSKGFWNHAPASMGGGQYRIINNTAGCIGPRLAVFREQPPQLRWQVLSRSNPLTLKAAPILTSYPNLLHPHPSPIPHQRHTTSAAP